MLMMSTITPATAGQDLLEIAVRLVRMLFVINNYRLTHSASELWGFTCTSSLTMNEKFQYRTQRPRAVLKISSSLLVNECR